MKDDVALLRRCLEEPARLGATAGDAFADMLERLESGRIEQLSEKQRAWLFDKCATLGIETGSQNLVSSGAVKPTKAERASLAEFHLSLGPKVTRPPGRR